MCSFSKFIEIFERAKWFQRNSFFFSYSRFQVNKGVTEVDLLSFTRELESQTDLMVGRLYRWFNWSLLFSSLHCFFSLIWWFFQVNCVSLLCEIMCLFCNLAQGSSADRPEKPRWDSAADPQAAGHPHGADLGKSSRCSFLWPVHHTLSSMLILMLLFSSWCRCYYDFWVFTCPPPTPKSLNLISEIEAVNRFPSKTFFISNYSLQKKIVFWLPNCLLPKTTTAQVEFGWRRLSNDQQLLHHFHEGLIFQILTSL